MSFDTIQACDLMTRRLSGRGENLDMYAFWLVEPLLQFADKFRSQLGAAAKATIGTTIAKAKSTIGELRSIRKLDNDEERLWRQLRGR
jgi:hypothetical protein